MIRPVEDFSDRVSKDGNLDVINLQYYDGAWPT